jgi:hypothetical protein
MRRREFITLAVIAMMTNPKLPESARTLSGAEEAARARPAVGSASTRGRGLRYFLAGVELEA